VATLTLNRPERHNSLTPELLEQLLAELENLCVQPAVKAAVLQASGRSFSTGGDLAGFGAHPDDIRAYADRLVGLLNQAMLAMIDLPAPIVVAVQGAVTGGGLGLILAADSVLVTPEATFTPYYGVVGFSPDGGWTALLPELIGRQRAALVLMRNASISADQAVAWGLVGEIVPSDRLRDRAQAVAREIAGMQPGAVQRGKRLLWAGSPVAERLEAERRQFVEQIGTAEAQNGMALFLKQLKQEKSGPA
jgi:enoyl-CoA hydratase/carnithine racemase